MNLRNIFRRNRPTPPPTPLHPHEAKVIAAWGFTEYEWAKVSHLDRAFYRANYTKVANR